MDIKKEEYILKGKPISIDVMIVDDREIIITGNYIKIGKIKEEWDEDIEDPKSFLEKIKDSGIKADIFTFMQRLPESKPKFSYYMEWDNVAALPITTYENWFYNQIHRNHRNKIKLAEKKGITVKQVPFSDELVRGITDIYNETSVRQGRPYWNYGMDFDLAKKENSFFMDRSDFIGAYYKDELIGFIRIVYTDRFARTMGILSKVAHRDKAPTNALFAKAVEICAEKKIPYIVYAKFDYGKLGSDTLMDFKRYNGFESIILPRYYIPLSTKGKIGLKLHLHLGVIGLLPEKLVRILRHFRNKWYSK